MKELEDMRNDELFTTVVVGIQILRDNERKLGYADGKADTPFTDTEEAEKKAYERGLNEAWDAARKMCYMKPEERLLAFDVSGNHLAILSDLTASKAIVKLKAFEQKQKCKECKKTKDPIFYGHCVGECDYAAKQTEDEIKVGKALSQQPCDDAVSRADVIELIERGVGNKSVTIDGFTFGKSLMLYHIKQLPSVTQKSCEDAISRQAALNSLIDNTHLEGYDLAEALDAIENKEKLPPVTQKPGKWIPVSERLPEDNELVLFSTKTDRVFEGRFFADNTDRKWYAFRDETFAWNNVVNAWMSLPEPYKAENDPQESEDKE